MSQGDAMHERLDVPCEQDDEMDAILAERYQRALKASTDGDGRINFDWLVMHIWLARVDALQSAYAAANLSRLAGDDGSQTFGKRLDRMRGCVARVLPRTLPLMADFSELTNIHRWREGGGAIRVANDSDFLHYARNAGLPLSSPDIVYALGPDGPAGSGVFMAIESHVKTTMLS